jgi:hypothetical protein
MKASYISEMSINRIQPGIHVKVTSPAPRDAWLQIHQADPYALPDQTPMWLDCMLATGQYQDASRLYEINDTKMVLPMVKVPSAISGFAVEYSNPHAWGIGGLISSRPLKREHIGAVFEDLQHLNLLHTTIRPNPMQGELWRDSAPARITTIPRLAHVLDLEGGFEKVWSKRFAGYTRTKVRKAEKSGLEVECDCTGRLIPIFYNLLIQSVDRWATRQHEPLAMATWRARRRDPISKLELIARKMGDQCCIWMAWYKGEPAAAIIVLKGTNAHSIRGAMNKELAGPTEANTLIQSLAIEDICRSGCRYYHLGETGSNQSLAHFKARFGAVGYPYAEYVVERLPLTAASQKLRSLIKTMIGFKDA